MASAWGASWGLAFGAAFGLAASPPIVVPEAPLAYSSDRAGNGGVSVADWERRRRAQQQRQIQEEDELIITAVVQMIASGALG